MSRPGTSHHVRKASGRWDNSDWADDSPSVGSPTSRQFAYRDRDGRDSRDYSEDRYRPRARDPATGSRAALEPTRSDKKCLAQAEADIAKLLSQSHKALADQVKWSTKKDQELRVFQRRENDYKKAGEGRFPAMAESQERHRALWKKQEELYDNEIAKVEALSDKVYNNLAHEIVECLPVGEIKTNQIIEGVKQDIQRLVREAMSTASGRIETLEKEVLSLKESRTEMLKELAKERENTAFVVEKLTKDKESQAPVLKRLIDAQDNLAAERKKFTEQQKTIEEEHKRQSTVLNDLVQEVEKVRSRNALYEIQAKAMETVRKDNAALHTQVSDLQMQISSLKACVERVDAQCTTLKEASQVTQSEATTDTNKTPNAEKLADLERRMNDYGSRILNFNAKDCSEIIKKVQVYPSWENLEARLKRLHIAFEEQIGQMKRAASDNKDASAMKKELDSKFADLSKTLISFIQEYSSRMKEDTDQFDRRLKTLEADKNADKNTAKEADKAPTAPVVAGAAPLQAPVLVADEQAISRRPDSIASDVALIRQDLNAWRNEVDQRCAANEGMILNMDKQFQNITTTEMARIIVDHIKKIPPAFVSQDMQNFHDRLTKVETWQTETMQRQIPLKKWTANMSRYMPDELKKRSAPDEHHQDRQDKRARIESRGAPQGNGAVQVLQLH
ncbi:hypothetical protein BD289DRAFT_291480 [Coniella lustricola]|uniref:Uncharacterized protein n=1 Tax=Coniella lustricola TaxID=2025994 RepID=A0A2T3A5C2_9PEZI|nr:hypothetical protein BD289DRAFT_291480 [Coniella lustricola]